MTTSIKEFLMKYAICLCILALSVNSSVASQDLYQGESNLSYSEITKIINKFDLSTANCNNGLLTSLRFRLFRLQEKGVISINDRLKSGKAIEEQRIKCRRAKLLRY